MTLLSYLLRKHAVWRNCKLRIFAIAQLKDNSVAMKENLVQSLKFLRIEAEADVLELGDYDISEFAYERTIKLKEREQLLKNVAGSGNILAMPSAASSFSLFGNQQGEGGGGGGAVTGSMPRARKMSVAGVSELMMSRFRAPKTNAAAVAAAVAANGGSNSSESPLLMMASSSSRNSLAGAGRSGSLSDNLTAAVATTNNNINIDTPSQPPTVLPAIPLHILRETRSNPSLNNAVTSSEGGSGSLSNMNTENNNSSQQYDSLNRKVAMMNTSVKLNTLIRANSGGAASKCRLILCNLPAPSKLPHNAPENVRKEHALAYMQYLDCLTEGLERVILVKGTGTEVITTYF